MMIIGLKKKKQNSKTKIKHNMQNKLKKTETGKEELEYFLRLADYLKLLLNYKDYLEGRL